jgi:hypothetical protein
MTSHKHRKRLARIRAAKTGESYATALRQLQTKQQGATTMSEPDTTTTTTRTATATCTFCGKGNTDVKKLIAGPGVFICDECVALCVDIIAIEVPAQDKEAREQAYREQPISEMLALLPGMTKTAARVEAELARWIRRAVQRGATWDQVADSLESDVANVRARFEVNDVGQEPATRYASPSSDDPLA